MSGKFTRTLMLCLSFIFGIAIIAGCVVSPSVSDPTLAPTQEGAVEQTETLPTQSSDQDVTQTSAQEPTHLEPTADLESQPAEIQSDQVVGPALNPSQKTTLSIFTTADFSGAGTCVMCHIGLRDEAGTDVSLPTDWRSTMMANAARDPFWQAKVSSEVARNPELQQIIELKCTSCHMPMAETQAETDGQVISALADGFFNPAHSLHEVAINGVSCTLCHQVDKGNLGMPESFSGGYVVDTSTDPPNRLIYGPYQQPFEMVMQNHTGFKPAYSEHMASAELCATCHNLYTPYVDAQGNVLGEFPEQTPYTEWQYSNFGSQNIPCQSCHMPQAQGGVVISLMPGRLSPRQPFFKHYFVGGNATILQLFSNWGADFDVAADQSHFDTTLARVTEQLEKRTATLVLKKLELDEGSLQAVLQITPLTGHKFPTSFPSRRAWLHVKVTDADGNVVFESGAPDQNGAISGNDSDIDAANFEPHYDTITQPDQVQIYESIMGNSDGQVTYTLLRGATYLKDNRLLPIMTEKSELPQDIAVYGAALDDTNFVGGSDQVTYQVDLTGANGPFTFSAEFLYQTLSYRFVQDLLLDQTPLTDRFGGYYSGIDNLIMLVASLEPVTIE